jgi:hypothetical protein
MISGVSLKKQEIDSTFPEILKESIKAFVIGMEKMEKGGYFEYDMDWDDLYSTINICEVEQLITPDEAWNLREKYLGLERHVL